jgi:50S ribosomal subunit-associated GTPase HflX
MVFDVAGGARSMWPHYLENADIIIYVVDSTRPQEIRKVTDALHSVSSEIQKTGCLFICLLNKCDLSDAMSNDEFITKSKVYDIINCDFLLQRTSNVTNEGIDKLMERIEGYFRSVRKFNAKVDIEG